MEDLLSSEPYLKSSFILTPFSKSVKSIWLKSTATIMHKFSFNRICLRTNLSASLRSSAASWIGLIKNRVAGMLVNSASPTTQLHKTFVNWYRLFYFSINSSNHNMYPVTGLIIYFNWRYLANSVVHNYINY